MKIPDFTRPEIEYLLYNCNFTFDEEEFFLLRCKGRTLQEIADKMNVSYKTAYRINKRVKIKILKIL
jgi:predicted DNA-binding protein (UPF0251 family)